MDRMFARGVVTKGSLLSLALGGYVMGLLYLKPRLLLSDYPREVRDKVPPLDPSEKRQSAVASVILLGSIFGSLLAGVRQLKRENGGEISFGTAFLHAYALFVFFNAFDFLVLDYLIVTRLQPRFMILPGTSAADYAGMSLGSHFISFLRGLLIGLLFCLPVAWLSRRK